MSKLTQLNIVLSNRKSENLNEECYPGYVSFVRNFPFFFQKNFAMIQIYTKFAMSIPLLKARTGWGWVDIHINKGVTVRFGFDAIRISQIQTVCQEQSNGNALWDVSYTSLIGFGQITLSIVSEVNYIYTSSWGFQRCSFRHTGQCESLYCVERVTELAPRFHLYAYRI